MKSLLEISIPDLAVLTAKLQGANWGHSILKMEIQNICNKNYIKIY